MLQRLADSGHVTAGLRVERIDVDKEPFQGADPAQQEIPHELHVGTRFRKQVDQDHPVQRTGRMVRDHDRRTRRRNILEIGRSDVVRDAQIMQQPFRIRPLVGKCAFVQSIDFLQGGHLHNQTGLQAGDPSPPSKIEVTGLYKFHNRAIK